MPISEVYNCDCLEYMRSIPDKFFDLCIADPPYGIGADVRQQNRAGKKSKGALCESKSYKSSDWDRQAPSVELFNEILRVSKNAVVWGANHFISKLPYDSSCWIVWDKDNGVNSYADCELAWTNFNSAVRKFRYKWHGMFQENMGHKEERIHPTQKPIVLYGWLLDKYAIGGGKIFDPFLGSGSSRIAAYKKGYDFYACELDKDYFEAQERRFRQECLGEVISPSGIVITQQQLF
jgi:site-specific DNA-methyltransferase (adenine-specific)